MKKILQPIPEVRIEMKTSKRLKGEVGVFATRNLKKGSIIADANQYLSEKFISWAVFHNLDSITQKKIMDYCPGDANGFYAPPDLNYISIAWHLNHSCNPNAGFLENYNLVAVRDIKKGEELTWDYSTYESNPNFKMKCLCGSKNCRTTITGNDWKLLMQNKDRKKYISSEIKNLAKQLK